MSWRHDSIDYAVYTDTCLPQGAIQPPVPYQFLRMIDTEEFVSFPKIISEWYGLILRYILAG